MVLCGEVGDAGQQTDLTCLLIDPMPVGGRQQDMHEDIIGNGVRLLRQLSALPARIIAHHPIIGSFLSPLFPFLSHLIQYPTYSTVQYPSLHYHWDSHGPRTTCQEDRQVCDISSLKYRPVLSLTTSRPKVVICSGSIG